MQPPATALISQLRRRPPDAAAVARRRQWRILTLIWIVVLAGFATMLVRLRAHENQLDFSHYYTSAMALRAGQNPYTTDLTPYAAKAGLDIGDTESSIANIKYADYPPTFLLLFEAFAFFSPPVAYWSWIAFNVLALGAVLFLLLSPLARRDHLIAWLFAALALAYPPISDHFQWAQSQILVLLTIVLAARWMDEGNEPAAGMMLALATLLRAFPGVLAGYLVVRRKWRTLGYMALGLAIGMGITLAFLGADRTIGFVGRLGFLTGDYWIFSPSNVAVGSFVSRLFLVTFRYPFSIRVNLIRRSLVFASQLAILALTVWATKSPGGERDRDRRALSLWIVAMILVSPTAWLHYLVLLLMPLIEVVSAALERRASYRAAAAAVVSYVLPFEVFGLILAGPALAGHFGRVRPVFFEVGFASLAIAYIAVWWFVRDGACPGLDASHDQPVRAPYVHAPQAAGAI